MMKFQFGSSICENSSLVPELWKKNYILVPGDNSRFWSGLWMNYGQNSSIAINL